MSGLILNFVQILVLILQIAIIGRAVLSWFPINPQSPLIAVLNEITEPILAPLRRVVPRIGMIDITPMVAIFVLYIIQRVMAGGL
ncbi:MAG: YggT family protein [Dehalococcoidia bacterium]|jgi:YggT family protein